MAWGLLLVAGLVEVVWVTAMKQSEGFTRFWPSLAAITAAMISFALLSIALRYLPVGTGYAVWVGVGAVGVAIAGMIWFGDHVTPLRFLCIGTIIAGVIGLRLIEN
ncbi:DMT family transporter [Nocardia sp. NBC_01329]|uniref:DMT family transporter n=1 Tax=Nocardia sp. NBC_01329 TaxID=2903594 RepID=UPI002E0F6DD0|nr:multidrug efflux SMR transporter [Nocardia sp. NBC_01329]